MARHLRRQRRSRPTRWHGAVGPVPHLPRLDAHDPRGRVSATSVIPPGGITSPSPDPVWAHSPTSNSADSRTTRRCEPNFGSVTDTTPCVALHFPNRYAHRTRAPAAGEWSPHRPDRAVPPTYRDRAACRHYAWYFIPPARTGPCRT